MGKKYRRSVVLKRQPILVTYCLLLRKTFPFNDPNRFVLVKVEDVVRFEGSNIVKCDSTWIKKAMKVDHLIRPVVRLAEKKASKTTYEKALLIECFENYHDGIERITYLKKSTPSRGRGKRIIRVRINNTKYVSAEIATTSQTNNDIGDLSDATSKSSSKNEEVNKRTTTMVISTDTNITHLDSEFDTIINFTENNEEENNNEIAESMTPITSPKCIDEISLDAQSSFSSKLSASYEITRTSPTTTTTTRSLNIDITKHCHSPNEQNRSIRYLSGITISETNDVVKSPIKVTDCKSFDTTSHSSMDCDSSSRNEDTSDRNGKKNNNRGSSEIGTPHTKLHLTNSTSCDIMNSGIVIPSSSRLHIRKKLTYTPDDGTNEWEKVTPMSKSIICETPLRAVNSSPGLSKQSYVTNRKNKRTMNDRRQMPRTVIYSDDESEPPTDKDSSSNADHSIDKASITKLQRENAYYKKQLTQVLNKLERNVTVPKKKKKYENRNLNKKIDKVVHDVSTLLAIVNNKANANENTSNVDEIEAIINSEPNSDGKILVNGHPMYANAVHNVFEANTMKKRCNKIIDALWTRDEQLNLALHANDRLINFGCRSLTYEEINTIKSLSQWLQRVKQLPTSDQFSIEKNHRKWISDHLKHNREMYAPEKRDKYLTRKRENRENKKQRVTTKSSTMEKVDADATYEKLKSLLLPTIYDEVNANEGMEKDQLISLNDICEHMEIHEHIVKQILTPDTCIITEDTYYHLVDFKFEMSELYKMLSQLKALNYNGTAMKQSEILEKLKVSENYDEKMTNYLIEKYTTPIGKGKKNKKDQVYRLQDNKIIDVLFAYIVEHCTHDGQSQITYRSLMNECKKLPYCDKQNELHWKMIIIECCIQDHAKNNEITDDSLIALDDIMEWTHNAQMIMYQNIIKLFDA